MCFCIAKTDSDLAWKAKSGFGSGAKFAKEQTNGKEGPPYKLFAMTTRGMCGASASQRDVEITS